MSKYLGLSKCVCFMLYKSLFVCLFVCLFICMFVCLFVCCCGQFGCTCRKGILFHTKLFAFLHVTIINFAHFFFLILFGKSNPQKKLGGSWNWNLRVNLLRQTRQSFKNKFKIQKQIIKNCKLKMYCESKTILLYIFKIFIWFRYYLQLC